jgi:hypothetical protein
MRSAGWGGKGWWQALTRGYVSVFSSPFVVLSFLSGLADFDRTPVVAPPGRLLRYLYPFEARKEVRVGVGLPSDIARPAAGSQAARWRCDELAERARAEGRPAVDSGQGTSRHLVSARRANSHADLHCSLGFETSLVDLGRSPQGRYLHRSRCKLCTTLSFLRAHRLTTSFLSLSRVCRPTAISSR